MWPYWSKAFKNRGALLSLSVFFRQLDAAPAEDLRDDRATDEKSLEESCPLTTNTAFYSYMTEKKLLF